VFNVVYVFHIPLFAVTHPYRSSIYSPIFSPSLFLYALLKWFKSPRVPLLAPSLASPFCVVCVCKPFPSKVRVRVSLECSGLRLHPVFVALRLRSPRDLRRERGERGGREKRREKGRREEKRREESREGSERRKWDRRG
jgi:hypothetical protein